MADILKSRPELKFEFSGTPYADAIVKVHLCEDEAASSQPEGAGHENSIGSA
jgi:hypothetical protein